MGERFLGIDTSNYTTSAALFDGRRVLENRKLLLPVKPGEKGLRQSDAVFHHVRQLPQVLGPLLEGLEAPPGAVGVSVSPTTAEGSYMPCFLVGKNTAGLLGQAWKAPVEHFSHQQGHIAAALYSAGRLELLERRFLAFHVSGGTTEALLVQPDGEGMPHITLAAHSLDLKAGQAVDRVGLLLGLSFPCGPELERLALQWEGKLSYRPVLKGHDCSLSGIENQCKAMVDRGEPPAKIARHCLEAIAAVLDKMCSRLLEELGPLPVVFSGGVCSNSLLRQRLGEKYSATFAAPEFSSDNAAGGGGAGLEKEVPRMNAAVLTVSQVNFFIKSLIEGDGRLQSVVVSGEISNFTDHYRSGHLYFSLKDEKSVLKAVMFSSAARRLKFRPQDGMKVLIRGRVAVYEPTGQYQLYAEDMQPEGIGALSLAFQQLKERLAAQGLFDREHKRAIPAFPERIGVVTSPTGAAVRDILQITARRWPLAKIVLAPVLVQGSQAPGQIVAALGQLDRQQACDVIILGRGGGSLEDLWAFNDEQVARAVYACSIPVVSAVGHETDYTICDFVADLRAPTPSAAAELCTPDWREALAQVLEYHQYFHRAAKSQVEYLRQSLDLLVQDSPLGLPEELLQGRREALEDCTARLAQGLRGRLLGEQKRLAVLSGTLDALSPLRVLSRGYAMVTKEGRVLKSAGEAAPGDKVAIRLAEGELSAEILEKGE